MKQQRIVKSLVLATLVAAIAVPAQAHKLRAKGAPAKVAESALSVTPTRDWNQLSGRAGKKTETWTLDGAQLNDVTFFGGIEAGKPLVRERHKKKDPLPKFTRSTLLVELPELLEGTYRTDRDIGTFQLLESRPKRFLGAEGVLFAYEYTDVDALRRKGEARAAIIDGKLYMMTFDAPVLHYYDRVIEDARALADSATL